MSAGTNTSKKSAGFTAQEKAAVKARALELKAEARASKDRQEGEKAVLAAIAALSEPDRSMARRLHEIIKEAAPVLAPKTWYGFPSYAKDGKIICFFQYSQKFNARYSEFCFADAAKVDDGDMWPTRYALKELNAATEAKIRELVKKAIK